MKEEVVLMVRDWVGRTCAAGCVHVANECHLVVFRRNVKLFELALDRCWSDDAGELRRQLGTVSSDAGLKRLFSTVLRRYLIREE